MPRVIEVDRNDDVELTSARRFEHVVPLGALASRLRRRDRVVLELSHQRPSALLDLSRDPSPLGLYAEAFTIVVLGDA